MHRWPVSQPQFSPHPPPLPRMWSSGPSQAVTGTVTLCEPQRLMGEPAQGGPQPLGDGNVIEVEGRTGVEGRKARERGEREETSHMNSQRRPGCDLRCPWCTGLPNPLHRRRMNLQNQEPLNNVFTLTLSPFFLASILPSFPGLPFALSNVNPFQFSFPIITPSCQIKSGG